MLAFVFRLLDVNFDVNKAIQQLTDTLGKYGPVVWEAVIRQVYVNAAVSLVWAVLFILGGIAGYKLAMKLYHHGKAMPNNHYSADREMAIAFGLIGAYASLLIGTIAAAMNLTAALQDFINPVWAAVQMLKTSAGQ